MHHPTITDAVSVLHASLPAVPIVDVDSSVLQSQDDSSDSESIASLYWSANSSTSNIDVLDEDEDTSATVSTLAKIVSIAVQLASSLLSLSSAAFTEHPPAHSQSQLLAHPSYPDLLQCFATEHSEPLLSISTLACQESSDRYILWTDIKRTFRNMDYIWKRNSEKKPERVLFMANTKVNCTCILFD